MTLQQDLRSAVAGGRMFALLALAVAAVAAAGAGPGQVGERPDFATITAAVQAHFASLPDQRPQDIISRGQVALALDELAKVGWDVPDREAILSAVPSEGDRLVRQLRTPAGKRFMRASSGYAGAYDRLDRLTGLRGGERILSDLIAGPDGDKLVKYLTTSRGGSELGKMLSRAPQGADFNKPTGRIYTLPQLLARLQESYAATATGTAP